MGTESIEASFLSIFALLSAVTIVKLQLFINLFKLLISISPPFLVNSLPIKSTLGFDGVFLGKFLNSENKNGGGTLNSFFSEIL